MWKDKKLYLNKEEDKVSGVASGLADYFGVDVTLVRLVFVALGVVYGFWAVVFYIIASYVIPEKPVSKVNDKERNSYYTGKGTEWEKGVSGDGEEDSTYQESKSYYASQEELDLDDILSDRPTKENTVEEFEEDSIVEDEIVLNDATYESLSGKPVESTTEPAVEEVNEVGISEVWEDDTKKVSVNIEDYRDDNELIDESDELVVGVKEDKTID